MGLGLLLKNSLTWPAGPGKAGKIHLGMVRASFKVMIPEGQTVTHLPHPVHF